MTDRPVCPICSTEIHPNEPVVFKDGRIVHLRCLLHEPKPPAKATVTPGTIEARRHEKRSWLPAPS